MAGYRKLELLRTVRDPKYIILALLAPIGFYLLFSTLFGGQSAGAAGMTVQAALMVSMSMYGAMWAVLAATGPRIAQDRTVGWARQMRLLSIGVTKTLTARLIAATLLAGPAISRSC
jgi:ABC-2 type transport system permease protein